jgi:serine/threonine-protein kinase HipA
MLKLPFTAADLGLPPYRDRTRRSSVSGVQDKVQLLRRRAGFDVVESGGDHILKTVPRSPHIWLPRDVPANEVLTMDIASRVFRIRVAEHALVALADGEPAYLTRRFDRRGGTKIPQEDFCQLAGHSPGTHGPDYKYDASYEELAGLVRRFCPAHAVENPKVFFLILFNYAFSNGDAHLKNFSLYRGPQGDSILTPAYDLLDTAIHFPAEPSATALDFFADGHFNPAYETLGFHSSADFVELGACFGVPEAEVRAFIALFSSRRSAVERLVASSSLSPEARHLYLSHFADRLRALAQ